MKIDDLNKEQQEAVRTTEGPLLILAGAGSGKTRVLTTRIAYLIEKASVLPSNILAITFTNKAAKEMKDRVFKQIGDLAKFIQISTFHAFGLSLTRNDPLSGINNYGLSTSSGSLNGSSTGTQSADTTGIRWYGAVQDKAGNTNSCQSASFKMDKTAPSCSLSLSGTLGKNSWYTSNVGVNLNSADGISGVTSRGVTTSATTNYNGYSSGTQTSETSGQRWYGYVRNGAGLTNSCYVDLKKDSINPTCTTYAVEIITNEGVVVEALKSDYGSGPAGPNPMQIYAVDGDASWNIEDMAGNKGVCTAKVTAYRQYRRRTRSCLKYNCINEEWNWTVSCQDASMCPAPETPSLLTLRNYIPFSTEISARFDCEHQVESRCKCKTGLAMYKGGCPAAVTPTCKQTGSTCINYSSWGAWSSWSTTACTTTTTRQCESKINYTYHGN